MVEQQNWLELARQLPVGQKTRIDCPNCGNGTNTNAMIVNHGIKAYNASCFACGHNPFQMKGIQTLDELREIRRLNNETIGKQIKLPDDFTTEIPLIGRLWLYKSGLRPSVWQDYNIGYSERLQRVILPVYNKQGALIWFQCRALLKGQKPKYIQPSRDKTGIIFTSLGDKRVGNQIVVVEDILSAIRVGETTKAISLLGTKADTVHINTLSGYDTVTTWLDNDNAGIRGASAIRQAVSLLTDTRNINTPLDPKCYDNRTIRRIIDGTINKHNSST
jgi:DNA primase